MMKMTEGILTAEGKKFALVISRFNELVTKKLTDGAVDCLVRHKAKIEDIEIFYVPGSFELPQVCKKVASNNKFDAVIALGAVIRGDTPHFDFISAEVAKGVATVAMQCKIPVIFGVLTTENLEQALERSGSKQGNKGWDAALSAIEMVDLYGKMEA